MVVHWLLPVLSLAACTFLLRPEIAVFGGNQCCFRPILAYHLLCPLRNTATARAGTAKLVLSLWGDDGSSDLLFLAGPAQLTRLSLGGYWRVRNPALSLADLTRLTNLGMFARDQSGYSGSLPGRTLPTQRSECVEMLPDRQAQSCLLWRL
jgi:hypothetical protein